ncbi:PTS sugar transporter subunit IIA [Enterococcus dongliensis]|uniref:Ascorbate-specific PTS system EIIA component n=1 Tax=Enterococcus dongliensis TaxID=2559925 RepID=A0AAW8TJB4_9ENTE|nr:PTS sugar transporter subunit IIA [Enterococcus dongliensis]MDT2596933.1 PTS sugar transporter subunit IIA [Enterococcus dongliensis]MDT2613270.1 PTS sugar transporter subunit IIA [Enterococcus dongliensis]MDT2634665.1 PTS sugar transporter subunit IIA [Enterococcus dongliensis]MDT2637717.1 PTS sugar transporter subunit IIA [Enterococcus dongliensis]MDT2638612.1 PTS sugar transporter subunit IIA [Enterococcus dongliensis]
MSTILPKNQIQVIETLNNWREAVKLASEPLLKQKLITQDYIQAMIDSVEEYGPYMVIADYFALLHARPGEGVNQQSMSLLVVKEPIDMKAKPVKIFLVLAAKDNQSHLDSLQSIMDVFMDTQKYETILEGNKDKITRLFNEGGEKK